jgi:asparagine synthase (glutamine-hydrolysing)
VAGLLMCGLAGLLALQASAAVPAHGDLQRMIGALAHRGPDGTGFYRAGPVGLAHARLSIIDLATGDQPIANEDESIWVVFNGEIFNYVELRAELLGLGHRFRTASDTETLVHAYEEYGDDFPSRLNGQFAIALWDGRRQRLLLVRDRVGVRPLFYTVRAGQLQFASEVKALRALGKLTLDPQALAEIFTCWTTLGNRSAFQHVHSLPAGHLLIAQDGQLTLREYWRWCYPSRLETGDFRTAATVLRERLVQAVRLQLRADVPVGAYLSGGLDSSALVAMIRQFSSARLRTFSVAFDDDEFDESVHQQTMVRYLQTEHTTVRCTRSDIGRAFPLAVRHAESPLLRTAPVPLMLLAQGVRQAGFKVVLTGEGADEVFGGYDLFKEAAVRRFWARQPQSRARPALLQRLYPYLKVSPVAYESLGRAFYGQRLGEVDDPFYAHRPRWATTRRLWAFFARDLQDALRPETVEAALQGLLPAGVGAWEGLARDQFVEVQTLLMGYLLSSQGDRMAMAHSVEGRVPFLDHHVIEFANSLPARYKLRGLREKAILREAMRGLLPEEIRLRVKQPYRAPDVPSFFSAGEPLDYVAELLSPARLAAAGYFDVDAVTRLLVKCRTGRALGASDNMAFTGILSTMLLHEEFVS